MGNAKTYTKASLEQLFKKIFLVYAQAGKMSTPMIYTGLLGGGAYRGNRPLALAIHLMLQPILREWTKVKFHYPVFQAFGKLEIEEMEERILIKADQILAHLKAKGAYTIGAALEELLTMNLVTSSYDGDLVVGINEE